MSAKREGCVLIPAALFIMAGLLKAQTPQAVVAFENDVEHQNLQIVQRAREILSSPAKWNRADIRVCRIQSCSLGCPTEAKTFSLYCALKKATDEVQGQFDHRGAVMQEARYLVDEIAVNRKDFQHRLEGYNNDPTTAFADIQRLFRLLEDRFRKRLAESTR